MTIGAPSFEEILVTWLHEKKGYDRELIEAPSLETDGGWIGTEVTPGDPATCEIVFTYKGAKNLLDIDVDGMSKFVQEIAEISARLQAEAFWRSGHKISL